MVEIWVILSFVTLAVIIGIAVVFVLVARRRGMELSGKDYRYFFYIGLVYLIGGIVLSFVFPSDVPYFNFFVFMGIIFTAMGLSNFEKWKKK